MPRRKTKARIEQPKHSSSNTRQVHLYKGQTIINLDQSEKCLVRMISGTAAVYSKNSDSSQIVLTFLMNDFINFTQISWNIPSLKTVKSLTQCKVEFIDKNEQNLQKISVNKLQNSEQKKDSLSCLSTNKALIDELLKYTNYKQIQKYQQMKLNQQQLTIVNGKYTMINIIRSYQTTKLVDFHRQKLCLELYSESDRVLLKSETNGSYIVTIKLKILQLFLSHQNIKTGCFQITNPGQNCKIDRSQSVNAQPRTKLKEIFPYPARNRYKSHGMQSRSKSQKIYEINYNSYIRFKNNIEGRYMRSMKYGRELRQMAESRIFNSCLKKKRLKNDPLCLFTRKNQTFYQKNKKGNFIHDYSS